MFIDLYERVTYGLVRGKGVMGGMGLTVGDAFQTSFSALALMCLLHTVVIRVNINKSVSSL